MGTGPLNVALDRRIGTLLSPFYANIHSDSLCSKVTNELIERSRDIIKKSFVNKTDDYCVIFTGNGATGAARHFAHLINVEVGTIIFTVLEHLSNSTMWKYMFPNAESIYVPVTKTVFDVNVFKDMIRESVNKGKTVLVAMTACSNVLGSLQPVHVILEFIRKNYKDRVITCVDCAACTPYVDLKRVLKDSFDAAIASPHKFKGGNCTPGLLVVRKDFVDLNKPPFFPGGGTVWYSDSKCNMFSENVQKREEGGSKNMLGIIKTGVLFKRKNEIQSRINGNNRKIIRFADDFFRKQEDVIMLTDIELKNRRLPVYSFMVKDLYPSFVVKALSDFYGIQARSGVSCCFMLSDHMKQMTKQQRNDIVKGKGPPKTFGWVRISFHYDNDLSFVASILRDLGLLLRNRSKFLSMYDHVPCNNEWKLKNDNEDVEGFVDEFFDDSFFFF